MDKVKERQKRSLEDKESERWLEGAQTAATVLAPAARIVVVGDRESDIYQIFTRKPATVDLIVRARGNRKLADGGLLFETGAGLTPAVEMPVKVAPRQPRIPGDNGRVARVAVSFGQVTIAKPKPAGPRPTPNRSPSVWSWPTRLTSLPAT